jgi:hypothetical protein
MSFEITINGQTKTFETAAEMVEWRERMKPVIPKRRKGKPKTPNNQGKQSGSRPSP